MDTNSGVSRAHSEPEANTTAKPELYRWHRCHSRETFVAWDRKPQNADEVYLDNRSNQKGAL